MPGTLEDLFFSGRFFLFGKALDVPYLAKRCTGKNVSALMKIIHVPDSSSGVIILRYEAHTRGSLTGKGHYQDTMLFNAEDWPFLPFGEALNYSLHNLENDRRTFQSHGRTVDLNAQEDERKVSLRDLYNKLCFIL